MSKDTNGIATCNDIYTSYGYLMDTSYCPTKSYLQTAGLTVSNASNYADNQLVKFSDISAVSRPIRVEADSRASDSWFRNYLNDAAAEVYVSLTVTSDYHFTQDAYGYYTGDDLALGFELHDKSFATSGIEFVIDFTSDPWDFATAAGTTNAVIELYIVTSAGETFIDYISLQSGDLAISAIDTYSIPSGGATFKLVGTHRT